jgi:membrane-bound lytic murein transglycosylase B
MMCKALSILCFTFYTLVLSGCSSKASNVKEDLTKYMDQARLWAAVEAQINNAIASVRRDQFVHDDFVTETLKPVIGVAQQYVQQLENYQPRTPPLYNVHQEYIEAWRAHYFAMAALVDAAEKKDYIQLAKANNDLLEAQRSVSDALADLARLLREAGLQSQTPSEQPPGPPSEGFEVSPS